MFSEEETRRLLSAVGLTGSRAAAASLTLRFLLLFRHLYFASMCARHPDSKIVTYVGRTHNLHLDAQAQGDITASILSFCVKQPLSPPTIPAGHSAVAPTIA
jgi:hypothetical protein